MSLLFRIVYAAHAKGTHHKLALDAVRALAHPEAERWQRLFLKHAEAFMQGAKAPDDQFKDFKNHVLHVRDGYWGGALDKAEEWYGTLCASLRAQDWEKAVWSAGVLSHYVTDPVQPFHTGQSEAENSIHRAAEWSISRSYDDLRAQGLAEHGPLTVSAGDGPHWLRELVCRGAEKANVHYETLIAHYDLAKGVVDPPAGLDGLSRKILAELVLHASAAFAAILERAVTEAAVAPPDVNLTLDTIMAAIKIPAKTLAKRLADAEDRRIVTAMFDELSATGRVEASLPEDDRVVRNLYAVEIEAPQQARLAEQRAAIVARSAAPSSSALAAARTSPTPKTPPPALAGAAPAEQARAPSTTPAPRPSTAPRHYLALADNIERAPTIGPRTAERLAPLGVTTVEEFLMADPHLVSGGLGLRAVTADTIVLWQDQCRLMLDIPGLRGGQAELLANAGYRSRDALVAAEATDVCAAVLAFAASPAGQRLLRDGAPPDIERIKGWLAAATVAQAA